MAKKVYIQKGNENSNDLLARAINLREAEMAIKLLNKEDKKEEKKEEKPKDVWSKLSIVQKVILMYLVTFAVGPLTVGLGKVSILMMQRILQ